MKQLILLLSVFAMFSSPLLAQPEDGKYHIGHETKIKDPIPNEGMIKGSVHALHYLEHLVGASVDLKSDKHERQVDTDKHGHFEFAIEPGTYQLTIAYEGFKSLVVKEIVINDAHETHVNIGLVEILKDVEK